MNGPAKLTLEEAALAIMDRECPPVITRELRKDHQAYTRELRDLKRYHDLIAGIAAAIRRGDLKADCQNNTGDPVYYDIDAAGLVEIEPPWAGWRPSERLAVLAGLRSAPEPEHDVNFVWTLAGLAFDSLGEEQRRDKANISQAAQAILRTAARRERDMTGLAESTLREKITAALARLEAARPRKNRGASKA